MRRFRHRIHTESTPERIRALAGVPVTLSRSKPLRADRSHGPPVEVPTMGVPACPRCHRPYRWSSETGQRTKPPWGPCSGLKRSELERTSRLSPVSRSNSGREHQKDMEFRDFIRGLPCVACGSPPPSDPHHVYTWGSGHGDWLLRDGQRVGNLTPLCRSCHDSLDAVGGGKQTFEAEHGISLADEARRLGERYEVEA